MTRRTCQLIVLVVSVIALGVVGFGLLNSRAPDPLLTAAPPRPELAWTFDAPAPGGFVAAPLVTPEAVVVSAVLTRGLSLRGAVYAVDPASGRLLWESTASGTMRPSASAPVVHQNRVIVGEGMHADFVCFIRALDLLTGTELWQARTADHVEGAATIAGETVLMCAGNEGLLALDGATGTRRWQAGTGLHLDARPAVSGEIVVVGSGPSRRFRELAVIAVQLPGGNEIWRTPMNLPAWGSPRIQAGRVYVGLGNGRMTTPAAPPEQPAGALVCLDLLTGRELWRVRTADAVFQQPTVHNEHVYFGCRDGSVQCVNALSGSEIWRTPRPGPVIAPVAVAGPHILTVTQTGLFAALDAATGTEVWRFDLQDHTKTQPLCVAAPVVDDTAVYLATELDTPAGRVASLYRFTLPTAE